MFTCTTPIRFADIDQAGIVYYPRFFHLFHLAFEELWRARVGPRAYADLLVRDRIGFPAVKADCEFVAPLRFGDVAEIELGISRLGTKSITFRYNVHRAADDRPRILCATGHVVAVVVDLAQFVAIVMPDRVVSLLADLVDE